MAWMPPDPYSRDPDFLKRMYEFHWFEPEGRKYSGVILMYAEIVRLNTMDPVYKDYYYVPSIPKIRDQAILLPLTPMTGYPRIAQSLDTYPPNFGTFDCAWRQVEPYWFLQMFEDQFQF